MSDENKISINVELSDDGKNQIIQYVQAFDSLRDSVNGLSKPLNSFSNNLNSINRDLSKYTDSINKLNSQNQELISSGDKITNKLSDASTSFSTWGNIIVLVTETLKSWQIALSGGLAILTTFLPEIIKFATALFQGKDAINAMVQNLKNLNEVMGQANKDAVSQTTRLQILYKSATDVNNANADRINSVKELKREFPEYLGHLKDEDILNGKAKKNYDVLSKSIFENAKAKAALNKIIDSLCKKHAVMLFINFLIFIFTNKISKLKPYI